jgi:hypothetical protein
MHKKGFLLGKIAFAVVRDLRRSSSLKIPNSARAASIYILHISRGNGDTESCSSVVPAPRRIKLLLRKSRF